MRRDDEEKVQKDLRRIRLEDVMREELVALLRDDIDDPTLQGLVVTALVLARDLRHVRVHVAVPRGPATPNDVERALARATPFLRARLADAVETKRTPELRFVVDEAALERGEEEP